MYTLNQTKVQLNLHFECKILFICDLISQNLEKDVRTLTEIVHLNQISKKTREFSGETSKKEKEEICTTKIEHS